MRIWRKIRGLFEGIFVFLGFVLIPILPRAVVLGLANAMGAAGYALSRKLRKIARANLDIAFGDSLSPDRKTAIIRSSFKTFALVTLDLFWFSRFSRGRIGKYVEIDESFQQHYINRPGAFVGIAAHLGNWEIMGQLASLAGDPISSVATPLKNGFADVILNRLRRSTGQVIQQRKGALRELLKIVKGGGSIALVMDQNTRVEDGGFFVEFFDLPVPVSKAPAFLAIRTGSVLGLGYCIPKEKGRYRIYIGSSFHLDGVSIEDGTRTILAKIEAVIREYPERWLWMYKRWKHIPEGDSGERYPFYARR